MSTLRRMFRRPVTAVALVVLLLIVVSCVAAPLVAPYDPLRQSLFDSNQGPSAAHLLGTDALGRDILSRLMYGGRITLAGAMIALAVFLVLGVPAGLLAGSVRGWIDVVLTKAAEIVASTPAIIIVLVVLAVFGTNPILSMITVGGLGSPSAYRVVRGSTIGQFGELYVKAARASGLTHARVLARHVFPALLGPIVVQASLFVGSAVLIESGLAFLGFSVQPPNPSWGSMIADASRTMSSYPWQLVPPGLAIGVTVLCLGLVGDGIRDAATARTSARSVPPAAASALAPVTALAPAGEALLEVRELRVEMGSREHRMPVVEHVSFDVRAGECVGLVGESGSGKSVTVKAVLGSLGNDGAMTGGTVEFDARRIDDLSAGQRRRLRAVDFGYVPQEPMMSLDPAFTVAHQLAERIRVASTRRLSAAQVHARSLALLEDVRLAEPTAVLRRYPHELSGGMAQRVNIAFALAGHPRILFADEPTTALDVTTQQEILDLLSDLQQRLGLAIVLVTHDWGVLSDMCERALVMYRGRIVEASTVEALFADPQHPHTKALVAQARPAEPAARIPSGESAPRLLVVDDLTVQYQRRRASSLKANDGVSIEVAEGETVGVVGESGSGKSTLADAVLGFVEIESGTIQFRGNDITRASGNARRLLTREMQPVFQNPYGSLNPARRIGEILAEPLAAHRIGDERDRMHRVAEALELVGLPADAAGRYPSDFSGGQRQRIAVARAMILEPSLIVCDEAVSALDPTIRTQVLDLLRELQLRRSVSYLFITHDLAVVDGFCDRLVVMQNGRVVEQGATADVLRSPRTEYTRRLLAAAPVADPVIQRARKTERNLAHVPRA